MPAPNIGYNPANYTTGMPSTQEAWAIQQASIWTAAYHSGSPDAFGAQAFTNTYWASIGLAPLPPAAQGAGAANPNNAVDPSIYQSFLALATHLASQPGNSTGVNVPNLPSGGPIYDDTTRNQLYGASQNEANNATQANIAAGNNATQLAIAQAGETGANQRTAAQIAAAAAHDAWAGGQNAQDRALTAQQNDLQRAHDLAVTNLQEAGMDRRQADELANRMSITQLQEAGASSRQAAQIAADAQQNELQRNFQAGESERDRQFRTAQAEQDRAFQGDQNAKDRAQQLAIANLTEAGMDSRAAADIASRMSIAQLQEAGASARNAAQIAAQLQVAAQESADRRYSTDVNADVQRQDITSREGIAAADRASRENIVNTQVAEQAREFDLQSAEDRRQFNADLGLKLLTQGVELSRHPVDWLAYQYYMESIAVPLGTHNFAGLASMMGAVPPTGPSAAGPVVGGPAAMDGDTALAQQAGVRAGFVGLAEAIAQNPGNTADPVAGHLAAQVTSQQYDVPQVEQQLAQERQAVIPAIGDNPITQELSQKLTAAFQMPARGAAPAVAQNLSQLPAATATPATNVDTQGAQPTGAFGAPATPANAAAAGVFTGAGSATPGAVNNTAPSSGPGTPQGTSMLQSIADQLGLSVDELQQHVPTDLLAGGYSREQIINSPVIQALLNGKERLSSFRTAAATPVAGAGPGSTGAFGIDLGLRGGQDINAGLLLKGTQAGREMVQGAVEGAGFYWPDATEQSLRAAPIGAADVGAFGRRRY